MAAARRVATALARSFPFGQMTAEDVVQQCLVYALEARRTGKYRPECGDPRAFLRVMLLNRLRSSYRSACVSGRSPCPACAAGTPCAADADGRPAPCGPHAEWAARTSQKQTLVRPAFRSPAVDRPVDGGYAAVDAADLLDSLPAYLRPAAVRLMQDDPAGVDPDTLAELREWLAEFAPPTH